MSNIKIHNDFFSASQESDLKSGMKSIYIKNSTLDPSKASQAWSEISKPMVFRFIEEFPALMHRSLIITLRNKQNSKIN